MRADFHQRRAAQLLHHLPGGEALARRHQAAKINGLIGGGIHPTAHRSPQRRDVPGFKQRPDAGVKTAITIVEAEKKSLRWQWLKPLVRIQNVLNAHRTVAVMKQPGDLLIERAGAYREITLVGGVIFDIMVGQHQKAIRRPGFISLQLGALLRGEEGDVLSTHAEDKAQPDEKHQAVAQGRVQHGHP